MAGRFFLSFFYSFYHLAYFISKKIFKNFGHPILVKRPLEKLYLHPQWRSHIHNSPHQRGAVSKAEQPLFVQKNHFKTIKNFSISN